MSYMLNVGEAFNCTHELHSSLICNFEGKKQADQWVAEKKDVVDEFKKMKLQQKKETMANMSIIVGSKRTSSDLLLRYLQGHDCAT